MKGKHASKPPVRLLKLSDITADATLQPRAGGLSAGTVEEYAAAMGGGRRFPPLVVFEDDTGRWLAEGFHRRAAALKAGLKALRCEVRKGGRLDALLHACGSNVGHGLRRSNADKRRAVELLLAEFPGWSNPLLADKAGVSDEFVRRVRGDVQPPTVGGSRTGRDGKLRPARRGQGADTTSMPDDVTGEEQPTEAPVAAAHDSAHVGGPGPTRQAIADAGEKVAAQLRNLRRGLAHLEAAVGRPRVEAVARVNGVPVREGDEGLRWPWVDDLGNMVRELTGVRR